MPERIRILHVEDRNADTELLEERLAAAGMRTELVRVETDADFVAALETREFDLILSDYSLPGFSGAAALAEAQRLRPGLPFVFLSGTIGEENAVEMLKRGATDYVLKDRPLRLMSAINRALKEAEERRSKLQAEEALRRSEERFQLVARATNDAIWDWDVSTGEMWWNDAVERLLGYPHSEVGRDMSWRVDRLHPDDRERLARDLRAALDGSSTWWTGEYRCRRADGSYADVFDRAFVLRDIHGRATRCIGSLFDMTERRKTEQQLLRAQRLESLGTLAGGIAHDLNNVLAPILAAVQLLKRRIPDERHQRLLTAAETSTLRGADLIKQVLTFARGAETERMLLQPRHVIREVEALARETFPRAVEIRCDLPNDLWPVSADATQLHQVLLNLCVNARDAMPSGGVLSLKAENVPRDASSSSIHPGIPEGDYVLLSVSDTGTGIAPEIADKIFEPFFTTKEQGKGTGLGLSTTLTIVKSHGGFLDVLSEPGGTTFKIHLPALPGGAISVHAHEEGLPLGSGEVVLLVDDEAGIREVMKETLESQGYRVLTAADGIEAVSVFERSQEPVALAITDMNMPLMDGVATARALWRLNPFLRVIVSSGSPPNELAPVRSEARQAAYLQKPCTAHSLLTMIAQELAK